MPDQLHPQLVPPELLAAQGDPSAADLARLGDYRWTMLDRESGSAPRDETPEPSAATTLGRSLMFSADTPIEAIEAKMRTVAAQVIYEARQAGNVESLRLRLHVQCVKQDIVMSQDALASAAASAPWIWASLRDEPQDVRVSVQSCSVSMEQRMRMRDEAPKRRPFSVHLDPIADATR